MERATLKDALKDWTDIDVAQYQLAVCLGLMASGATYVASGTKGVFWTDNAIGNTLYAALNLLTQEGVLEKRDEPDYQYRWNPRFVGTWE